MNDKRKDAETHFKFGANWASYAALIGERQIEEAKKGLLKLVTARDIAGRSFLDLGCGSGLHALAALRLGAGRVMAIDIDPNCVATAQALLSREAGGKPWQAQRVSVFDADPLTIGRFDVVYSWGVLHHTGSMWEAMDKAAALVAPGGLLVIALYRMTRTDAFWKLEKRVYAHAPQFVQGAIRVCYVALFRLACVLTGRSFHDYVVNYRSSRGMDFHHDVHDWLGGYPYETTDAAEIEAKLSKLGFSAERVLAKPLGVGIFGSGCDEFVYRRAG